MLYRLQQIDLQLDQAKLRLDELIQLIENDSDLRKAEELFKRQEEITKDLEKKLHSIEHDVEQQLIKIEQSEAALYGGRIKNPKELRDLEEEVKALKRYLQVLEDRQLESMIVLEQETSTLQRLQNDLNRIQQDRIQQNSRYLGEKTEIEREIQRLENERLIATSGIEPEYYQRYQTIRTSKKGIAVSRIQDKCCSACGTTLTGGLVQDARAPDRMVICPSCGRILYGG